MKKIAFINQRYGLEVNGGSEYYTRIMAEHLKNDFQVEVLTTKAIDVNWGDYYKNDIEDINGITVRRFSTDETRGVRFSLAMKKLGLKGDRFSEKEENEWIDAQGPLCTKLIQYLEENKDRYDVIVVVTYLYYPAVRSLPVIGDKAIFIPTAHDELYIHFHIFQKIFRMPKAYVFLTSEEKKLVNQLFDVADKPQEVIAAGVDVPEDLNTEAFKKKWKLNDYFLYVGRIEEGKNCLEMIHFFLDYKKMNPSDQKLVLIGKSIGDMPKDDDIVYCGFVSEEEKYSAIAGAIALIQPSKFESLSLVVLEALTMGTPVIVNEACEVLKGHCMKSNAGLYFSNRSEFGSTLLYMSEHPQERAIMSTNGQAYIDQNYTWKKVCEQFKALVEHCC